MIFSEPVYNSDAPPSIAPTAQSIVLDWTDSFTYNGEVQRFVLNKDGNQLHSGPNTLYSASRTDEEESKIPLEQSFHYYVKLYIHINIQLGTSMRNVLIFTRKLSFNT